MSGDRIAPAAPSKDCIIRGADMSMDVRFDEKGKFFTPRVAKDTLPAFIRTGDQVIVGHVYVRPEKRLKDDLSEDTSRFLPVTDARVYDAASEKLLYHSSF